MHAEFNCTTGDDSTIAISDHGGHGWVSVAVYDSASDDTLVAALSRGDAQVMIAKLQEFVDSTNC